MSHAIPALDGTGSRTYLHPNYTLSGEMFPILAQLPAVLTIKGHSWQPNTIDQDCAFGLFSWKARRPNQWAKEQRVGKQPFTAQPIASKQIIIGHTHHHATTMACGNQRWRPC